MTANLSKKCHHLDVRGQQISKAPAFSYSVILLVRLTRSKKMEEIKTVMLLHCRTIRIVLSDLN